MGADGIPSPGEGFRLSSVLAYLCYNGGFFFTNLPTPRKRVVYEPRALSSDVRIYVLYSTECRIFMIDS